MKKNKSNKVWKVIYIILIALLATILVASIVFGVIGAYFPTARNDLELWFADHLIKKEISLVSKSVVWILISSVLLVIVLSFKEIKNKYID